MEPRLLNRKELKAIKLKSGVDLHRLMLDVIGKLGTGEDLTIAQMMEAISPDVMDVVLDHVFPNNASKLDEMSYMELMQLTAEILGLTFGGQTEKKS